ncbi:MAG: histidine kinase [Dehalococcoidia bacterium]|nr:histidine kinase [Dehalococcoidia bacterium]
MSLQYKVVILVFGIILTTGIIGGLSGLYFQRQAAVEQFSDSTMVLAATLRDSIERDMLLPDREHIQQSVRLLGSRSPVTEVSIVSPDRRVYASSIIPTIGQTKDDRELDRVFTLGETITSAAFQSEQDKLYIIYPLVNKSACFSCHGSSPVILGAIKIGWDTTSLIRRVEQQTLVMLIIGGLAVAVMVVALSFTLRSAVVRPLMRLAASARRIATGNYSARVDARGHDEVGTVARSFNDMAQRIQERTEQLQQMVKIRGQLLDRLISVQEEERRRIARELHDEIGQVLSAIMMELSRTVESLPAEATVAREKLEKSRVIAAQSLAELRRMIYDLRPEVLDQLGLVPALRSYIRNRLEEQNIQVNLSIQGLKDRLPSQMEITLFRVVQEAVTNILRYAKATVVDIDLTATESAVTVTVKDNGQGFDVDKTLRSTESWGLRGIRERASVINGELTIESKAGQGTRLQLRIPL